MNVKSQWCAGFLVLTFATSFDTMSAQAGESETASTSDAPKTTPTSPYRTAAASEAYQTATAHDPHYDDPALWPAEDVKRAAYAKQAWLKGRLMVWAKPGVSSRGSDGADPKYWLEDGKPATKPFDENTDLVFPDFAGGMYWVSITDGRKYQPARFRHLTIGRGAEIVGHLSSKGNLWIKAGGVIRYLDSGMVQTRVTLRGSVPGRGQTGTHCRKTSCVLTPPIPGPAKCYLNVRVSEPCPLSSHPCNGIRPF